MLTAYARECERAGVRIPNWREHTGCKNIVQFKYSGENIHSGESSHPNATLNEVLDNLDLASDNDILNMALGRIRPKHKNTDETHLKKIKPSKNKYHPGNLFQSTETRHGKDLDPTNAATEGIEKFDNDDFSGFTDLNLGSLGHSQPAYRPSVTRIRPQTKELTKKEQRKALKKQRRRQRRLQRKRDKQRLKMEAKRKKALAQLRGSNSNLQSEAINIQGTNIDLNSPLLRDKLNLITLKRVKERGGGSHTKLEWDTGGFSQLPPFEMLLHSADAEAKSSSTSDVDEGMKEADEPVLNLLKLQGVLNKVNKDSSSEQLSDTIKLASGEQSAGASEASAEDYADLASLLASSRTKLPAALLEAKNLDSLSSVLRKNWKRRRPIQLN